MLLQSGCQRPLALTNLHLCLSTLPRRNHNWRIMIQENANLFRLQRNSSQGNDQILIARGLTDWALLDQ